MLTANALRAALEAVVMQAVLDRHFEEYPESRPSLAELAVADAHLGAAIQNAESDHVTVITSDPHDKRKVAEGRRVDVVAI